MRKHVSTPRIIVIAFVGMAVVGMFLLKIPAANNGISWLDAFFMSTSAVTVTSMSSVSPAEAFTPLGDAVLAILMQVGGIGIMTAATVGALLVGARLGFRELLVVREELASADSPRNVFRLLLQIALIALVIESVGAVVLTIRFLSLGYGFLPSLGYGVFNTVAAFANSGFDIFDDGFATFAGDWVIIPTICLLVIAGGFGFPVLVNLYYYARIRRLTLQSKLVMLVTAVLIFIGVGSVAVLEWTNPDTLGGQSLSTKVLMAMLQGITPRTAGFTTVTYSDMNDPTLTIQAILMFLGTGPVSTGGGIKVTTVALVFLILLTQIRGDVEVSAFGRRVPRQIVSKVVTVSALSAVLVGTAAILLMAVEEVAVFPAVFEATSAFATVGLSLGPSPGLSSEMGAFGKLLLAFLMFAGRVGALTVILALSARTKPRRYSYPEEDIAIG